jgi:hypothetical protein
MLKGQLTATIQGTDSDQISELLSILTQKAGRVIWNGFPTGVSSDIRNESRGCPRQPLLLTQHPLA